MDSSLLVFDVGYVCKSAITFFRFLLKSTIEKERKRERERIVPFHNVTSFHP